MGQSPDGSSYNEQGNGILFYQGSTDFGMRFPSIRLFTTSPTRFAKEGDILMSVRAPVGATNIANADCCIGRGLAAMNSKLGSITHLYHIIQDLKTAFDLRNDAGTTFGSITKDDLYNLVVLKPTKSILELYENICNPIFKQQMLVGRNIVHLIKQRDELLPLLMNGQVNCDLLITEIQAKVLGQCEYFRILMAGAWMRENVVGGWRFFFGGKCGERVGFYVFLVIFVD